MKPREGLLALLLLSMSSFVGCKQSITKKDDSTMIHSKVTSVKDVLSLFPKDVLDVEKRVEKAKKIATDGIAKLLGVAAKDRTFENTAKLLDDTESQFSVIVHGIHTCHMTHPDKTIRDACEKAEVDLHQFSVDAFLDPEIYRAFKAYVNGNAKKETLSAEEEYYLDESMKSFKRSGFHLPQEKFETTKKIKKELGELTIKFSTAVAQDQSSISVSLEDLQGLDEDFIDSLPRDGEAFVLKCTRPMWSEVLSHCSVEQTRKSFYRCFQNRAYPTNKPVLEQIIAKRDGLAKMLGFASFADFQLDDMMAKRLDRAEGFIEDLEKKVRIKESKEFERLQKDLPEGIQTQNGKINPWDLGFVKESYKKKHFDVDDREIAEYFMMERTVQGIFDIYQKFLGLEFKKIDVPGAWHEDVFAIEVYKKGEDTPMGWILLDLYPRENKYSHACCIPVLPARKNSPSVSVVIANFPKSTKRKPSLLKHLDVTTFFHEFGHAMHDMLGKTDLAGHAGTEVRWDFVEVPSQMFEEWMWDKDMLKLVSSHYKTGKPMPDALIDKMIKLKKFDSGHFIRRQCFLSLVSFAYFKDGAKKDLDAIYRDLYEKYRSHEVFDPEAHMYASFGHLMGYGARYYSYMWSLVFALDLFETIKKHGLLDEQIGKKLIDTLLGKGGSKEPDDLLRAFLGREPSQDALLRDIGVYHSE